MGWWRERLAEDILGVVVLELRRTGRVGDTENEGG